MSDHADDNALPAEQGPQTITPITDEQRRTLDALIKITGSRVTAKDFVVSSGNEPGEPMDLKLYVRYTRLPYDGTGTQREYNNQEYGKLIKRLYELSEFSAGNVIKSGTFVHASVEGEQRKSNTLSLNAAGRNLPDFVNSYNRTLLATEAHRTSYQYLADIAASHKMEAEPIHPDAVPDLTDITFTPGYGLIGKPEGKTKYAAFKNALQKAIPELHDAAVWDDEARIVHFPLGKLQDKDIGFQLEAMSSLEWARQQMKKAAEALAKTYQLHRDYSAAIGRPAVDVTNMEEFESAFKDLRVAPEQGHAAKQYSRRYSSKAAVNGI